MTAISNRPRIQDRGTVDSLTVRGAMASAADLLAGRTYEPGQVMQVLLFRQGARWLATASVYDCSMVALAASQAAER